MCKLQSPRMKITLVPTEGNEGEFHIELMWKHYITKGTKIRFNETTVVVVDRFNPDPYYDVILTDDNRSWYVYYSGMEGCGECLKKFMTASIIFAEQS